VEPPSLRSRLLAILAADVTGYSRLMSIDDRATVAALDAARSVFREHILSQGGRVIDMAGDSVMSVFDTAIGALSAALSIQRQLADSAVDVAEEARMRFRIGIHVGEVIEKTDGSVYGDGVNIAARLESLAEPGGVALSQAVHAMVARRVDAVFVDIGAQSVKNIAEPVRAFRARARGPDEAPAPTALAPAAAPAPLGNLAAALPTLFGRGDDIAALGALVQAQRMVSIVGPGGMGKTRLAEATASALQGAFSEGAWVVELAPVADPALLPAAVAQALAFTLPGRKEARAEVVDALRQRALLLVLDNCEHMVQGAGELAAAVIEGAARVHVLTTSRELLRVAGEHLYRLEALAVPPGPDLKAGQGYSAVRLFADRVHALMPGFVLSEQNIGDVVAICRHLDGLPLAIELAAARVPLLGVSGVQERLRERFRVLTSGARTSTRRQQTLRESIDWSHDLLSDDERVVFRRCAVFAGGFTLPAAQATLADERLDEWAVLDRLGTLVDKSLLVADATEPRRYRLLESAREYAAERLASSGEAPFVRSRHAAFFLAAACAAEPHVTSADRRPWLLQLRADLNNLRAAFGWFAKERVDAAAAMRLSAALAWFAYFEGLFEEGKTWLREAVALPGAQAHVAEHAAALSGAARLAAYSGDPKSALLTAEESAGLWRQAGNRRGLAYALIHHGIACIMSGQHARARHDLQEALACFHDLRDPWGVALASSYKGTTLAIVPGTEDQARPLLLEGRAGFQALGDPWGMSISSHYLGSIALRTGDHAMARELTEEMLANARELGDKYRIARNLHQLAEIDIALGRSPQALRGLAESLALNAEQWRLGDAALQLRLLTRLARESGAAELATRFAALAERHAAADRTMPPDDLAQHAADVAALGEALGPRRTARLWMEGAAMSLEDAADAARTLVG
jgi:predicted ATPase/class 3 adenylate cyclase